MLCVKYATVYNSKSTDGTFEIIRCILDCIARERKRKRDSPDFRRLMESLRKMTVRGDRYWLTFARDWYSVLSQFT